MKRSISTISNLKQNREGNSNRSKSPQRLVNGVRLYNFSEIDSYKHINKPYLNNLKKEHIKNKLDLEKSTEIRVAKRVKRNEMFISYNRNPFAADDRHSKSAVLIPAGEEQSIHNRTIIESINNLNLKRLNRHIQSKELDEIQYEAHNLSGLVQRQLHNATPDKLHFNRHKLNKSMIALPPKTLPLSTPEIEAEMEFEDILAIKEEKFSEGEKNLNIFKLLYDRNFFNRNLTLLDKYFFSFNSLFEKFQKYKIQIYRDMSRDSRANVSKKPEGQSMDRFETFSPGELNFNDLINVAAGRFTPQMVYMQINVDRANDNTNNSEINEDDICYREGLFNKSTMAENHNQSTKEIEEFLKLALTKKEEKYQKLNIYRKEGIKQKLDKISKLVSLSIYDKKLHRQLRSQIGTELAAFTDENYKYPQAVHERDSLIRANKDSKNKHQVIKLNQLIETFQIAKQHEKQVKQLINKRI